MLPFQRVDGWCKSIQAYRNGRPGACSLNRVGECGPARYSSLSVRLAGNSGGTAENVYFRPEELLLRAFLF